MIECLFEDKPEWHEDAEKSLVAVMQMTYSGCRRFGGRSAVLTLPRRQLYKVARKKAIEGLNISRDVIPEMEKNFRRNFGENYEDTIRGKIVLSIQPPDTDPFVYMLLPEGGLPWLDDEPDYLGSKNPPQEPDVKKIYTSASFPGDESAWKRMTYYVTQRGICHNCRAAPKKLSKCSACSVALYCCKDCQLADWSVHKSVCEYLKKK